MPRLTKDQRLDNLRRTAHAAIEYVGYANYDHRERAAKYAVTISFKTGRVVDPDEVHDALEN